MLFPSSSRPSSKENPTATSQHRKIKLPKVVTHTEELTNPKMTNEGMSLPNLAAATVEAVSVVVPPAATREINLSAHLKLFIGASTRFRNTLEVGFIISLKAGLKLSDT